MPGSSRGVPLELCRRADARELFRWFPRLQLFEFNDQPWVPALIRQQIVESLGDATRWGRLLDGGTDALEACLRRAGSSRVVELCAGSAAPSVRFISLLAQRGVDARLTLTDLHPAVEAWEALAAAHEGQIDFQREPVDVAFVPRSLLEDRVVLIVNALHHFSPRLARSLFHRVCSVARGVVVIEGLVRNPLSFVAMSPLVLGALLTNPFRGRGRTLERLAMLAPSLVAGAWDGVASALRMYRPAELTRMVEDVPGWTWEFGTFEHSLKLGAGSFFFGNPRAPRH